MSTNGVDFDYLRKIVRDYSGVVLDQDKVYLADLHLPQLADLAGVKSVTELVESLRSQPFNSLHIQAIEALVTNETSFFRDRHPFEALKSFIIPELLNKRANNKKLNIWCAACSTGQEPYSIALLIKESFPILSRWDCQIVATDFSAKVLARAREGLYTPMEVRRGLPDSLKNQYFHQQENEWQIDAKIRNMVDFRQINLLDNWLNLPRMDIIFMRNILIYFDVEVKKDMLEKVKSLLKPDGYLFVGGGETIISLDHSFEQVPFGNAISYRLR